jgi:hypothetical protein
MRKTNDDLEAYAPKQACRTTNATSFTSILDINNPQDERLAYEDFNGIFLSARTEMQGTHNFCDPDGFAFMQRLVNTLHHVYTSGHWLCSFLLAK